MHVLRTGLTIAALTLGATAMTACEGLSYLARGFTGEEVPAIYPIQDRPTLVLVDDPEVRLGNPALTNVVASSAAHQFRQDEVIRSRIVSDDERVALRGRLGDQYRQTAVDQIGRLLGAEQVIHVRIEDVSLQPSPGYYRPTVTAQVKLIDAAAGKRLFPPPSPIADAGEPGRGHPIRVEIFPRDIHTESRGVDAMLARDLAQRLGRNVAQLFYEHAREQPSP